MMNPAEATREIYWNITYIWVMYALLLPTAAIAGYGIYRHLSRWRRGLPLARFDRPQERIKLVVKHAVAQRRTARNLYAGLFHQFISYGFVILTIATTIVALDADFGTAIMRGRFYLYFQSFTVDLFGALVMLGVLMAALRRYVKRPKKLVYTNEAAGILALIFLMCLQGFLAEGWRIAVTNDPWGAWSPFGNMVARASRPFMTDEQMRAAHAGVWWFHLVTAFAFIAWLPYTKMMHVITAPLNIYTANLEPLGATLKNIDFEKTESFGVNSLKSFTWKDLLDFDACTECGRCTAVCPANAVGKELSPRDIILQLRDLMHERPRDAFGLVAIGGNGAMSIEAGTTPATQEPTTDIEARKPLAIIGAVPATSTVPLWQCTTCAACMEACPVFIEQMPKIVDMRRYLVMEEADFPDSMQEAVMSLERRGHPFTGTQATRLDWAEGLNVKHAGDARDAEVLLWVGCGGALIERNQKVTRATAQLLEQAGVKFAIMGRDEKCSGDPARRIGNEFLFEQLARENVENLKRFEVKSIVTACPHCFNTFKNEYPQYGGSFEVYHHSAYLAKLVEEGRLKPHAMLDKKITFHDPCYLGRQNGVYDAPRELVQISAARGRAVEMERSRNKSFCCGGGGGMSFVDEPPDRRVNQERAREALETGADVLAVGCPFCMTMMEDGINARKGERDVKVMDVSELLWEATKPRRDEVNNPR
ncbi:MAG: 4Fe-4S dicluster domain-containing protein [Pyrinomonadaceae bacterium]|nr:4Fe-4S dicluster domain-containing protein [Pyrinomonadaceae bacterium]